MTIVYVDVLFLINFSIDYIVLTLTSAVFHYHVKWWKELLTAFLMAMYSLWALLLCGSYIALLISAVASVFAACYFVYPIRKINSFLCTIVVFTGLSALLGSLVNLMFQMMKQLIGDNMQATDDKRVFVFAGLALISSVMIWGGNRLLACRRNVKSVSVTFGWAAQKFSAEMMVDSGNIVIEPLSGRRVLFLTDQYVKKQGMDTYINNNVDFLKYKRYLCIDTAVGKRTVTAYMCDHIELNKKVVHGVIAFMSDGKLTEYDGVFPSALL